LYQPRGKSLGAAAGAALVEALDDVLVRKPDTAWASSIRWVIAPHLTDAQLLARADADAKGRNVWLQAVVSKGSPAAVEHVVALLRSDAPPSPETIDTLALAAGARLQRYDDKPTVEPHSPTLSQATR